MASVTDSKLVLVTGSSGFLGTHIILRLLNDGYRVRALARAHRSQSLKDLFHSHGEKFEVFLIEDISSAQFPEALQNVYAVIHSAAALINVVSPEETMKTAVQGTLNILRQIEKAGIRRIVMTSSIATVINSGMQLTDNDWTERTLDEALKGGDAVTTYVVAKAMAEQEVWKFTESHPNLDVTMLNPPMFYGPILTNPSKPDYGALSTSTNMFKLLTPQGSFPFLAPYIDIRDIAGMHVTALKSPLSSEPGVGRKRMIVGSPEEFDFKTVLNIIASKRPELKDRLTNVPIPATPFKKVPFYAEKVSLILGMKKSDFIPLEKTVLDTVDSLLAIEKTWIANGYEAVTQIPDSY